MKTTFIITRPHESDGLSEFNEFANTDFFQKMDDYLLFENKESLVFVLNGEFLSGTRIGGYNPTSFQNLIMDQISELNHVLIFYHSHKTIRLFVEKLSCESIPYSSGNGFPLQVLLTNNTCRPGMPASHKILINDTRKNIELLKITDTIHLADLFSKLSPYSNFKLNVVLNFLHKCLTAKPTEISLLNDLDLTQNEINDVDEHFKTLMVNYEDERYLNSLKNFRDVLLPLVIN